MIIHKEVLNSTAPKSWGTMKSVASIHMLYTPPVSNNITLVGDDRLKID